MILRKRLAPRSLVAGCGGLTVSSRRRPNRTAMEARTQDWMSPGSGRASAVSDRTVGDALTTRRGRTTARGARNVGRLGAAATTGRALDRADIVVFIFDGLVVG